MRTYYDQLEALTDRVASEGRFEARRGRVWHILAEYYTDARLDELDAHLTAARKAVASSDEKAAARVGLVATGLEYTRDAVRLLRAAKDVRTGKSTPEAFESVQMEIIPHFTALAMDWSVSIAHDYSYLRRSLGLKPRETQNR